MTQQAEIVLIRHGEAHCNTTGTVGGPRTCTGLTNLGQRQVAAAAAALGREHAAEPFDALLTGPRLRLRQTASILADTLGLKQIVDDGLDGPRHGAADGQPWYAVKTTHRGAPRAHPDTPWADGAETWNDFLNRAGEYLAEIIEAHPRQRILIAAHGETIEALCTRLLGLPAGACSRLSFGMDHAGATRWQRHCDRFGRVHWILDRLNDTRHLTAMMPS